jgi:hypothetical protein
MKKLMLTTAIASVLTTAAIAQTTITGELRISYKDETMSKGTAGTGTSDTVYGFGAEQQINIQTKGKLNVGGLDYAAGFSIENDGEQTGTLFNENVYMDFTNASSGTTISFGRDHIQRSDTDFSATNLVGFTPNELSQVTNSGTLTASGGVANGSLFSQTIGAAPSQAYGAAIIQKTPVGSFSYNWVPNNSGNVATSALSVTGGYVLPATITSVGSSEAVNANTTAGHEYGFVGDLGVKGLTAHYFKNKNHDVTTASNTVAAEGKNFGAKYNFGQITVAANKKENQVEHTADSLITEKAYAIAYAVDNNVTVGVIHGTAERTGLAPKHKITGVNLGYNLGPVSLAVGYAQNKDAGGLAGADNDIFMARLIGAF